MKATIKTIKAIWDVMPNSKHKNRMLLFSKEVDGRHLAKKYMWEIIDHGDSFSVEGQPPTTDLLTLQKQVTDHIATLPYDSEYYIPNYREGMFEQLIIHDYMYDLGFRADYKSNSGCLVRDDEGIYGGTSKIKMSFRNLDCIGRDDEFSFNRIGLDKDMVEVNLHQDHGTIRATVKRDVAEIKRIIDGMLKPLLFSTAVNSLLLAEKLTDQNVDLQLTQLSGLSIKEEKIKLKEKLEQLINKLC